MVSTSKLDALLEIIREAKTADAMMQAEAAFFDALLDAPVYAHRSVGPVPPGRLRFVQFRRPDNGQTVLPFFTDLAQAEVPLAPDRTLVSMTGRELFELTRGATLMMNPNREQATLYTAEVEALLEGQPLGTFTRETLPQRVLCNARPPSIPVDDLLQVLRACFVAEATVRAGYLVEVDRPPGEPEETFLLVMVVGPMHLAERLVHAISLALRKSQPPLSLPLEVTCVGVDEDLPEICDRGIQFYGA